MASIKTSIELYDNFSDPMMDIVNAANAGTIAIENVQSAMNAGVDMSGINRATAAMQSFENTMQAIEAPSFPLEMWTPPYQIWGCNSKHYSPGDSRCGKSAAN